jgi:hypothetical protein
LLEQASRFLKDANIRDAPREKKVVFLQAKGVSAEDIETLLGKEKETQHGDSPELEAAGERAWSTVSTANIAARRPDSIRYLPSLYNQRPSSHLNLARYLPSSHTRSFLRRRRSRHH